MRSVDVASAMMGLQSLRLVPNTSPVYDRPSSTSAWLSRQDLEAFLQAFINLIERSEVKFTDVHDASRGIYGLQSLFSDSILSKGIKEVLPAMINAVHVDVNSPVDSRDLAMLVYSMRAMGSNSESSKQIIAAVAALMKRVFAANKEALDLGLPPILTYVRAAVSTSS
jgi:hypothetical protein